MRRDKREGNTPEYLKMINIWLFAIPCLAGSSISHSFCWTNVDQVCCCSHCFSPETCRQCIVLQHASRHFNDGPILALDRSVLLRRIGSGVFSYDPQLITVGLEFVWYDLTSSIGQESFCLELCLPFNMARNFWKHSNILDLCLMKNTRVFVLDDTTITFKQNRIPTCH